MPRRRPAALKSWQGVPPERMSTSGTAAQSILVISPRFGAAGQWCAMIADGAASNSEYHRSSASNTSSIARPSPPYPAQTSA